MRPIGIIPLLLAVLPWAQSLTYHGADFSSLANLEGTGISYKDEGKTTKFETILKNHGTNLARIRLWTSTNNADYSTSYGLALAKRAKAAGMSIMLDLHYSDTCMSILVATDIILTKSLAQGRTLESRQFLVPGQQLWRV